RYAKWCYVVSSGLGITIHPPFCCCALHGMGVGCSRSRAMGSVKSLWHGSVPRLHGIRSAWLERDWTSPDTLKQERPPSKRISSLDKAAPVERRLETTRNFLDDVLDIALSKESAGLTVPQTVTDILIRRADISERMGTKADLTDARYDLQRVLTRLPAMGSSSPTGGPANAPFMSVILSTPPSSPSAQRTLASALILHESQAVEETSLDLLRSIRFHDSSSPSPAQTPHTLYILHHSSIISIHLAEWLSLVAHSLSPLNELPFHPKAPGSKVPHPPSPDAPLLPESSKSISMKKLASGRTLLRGVATNGMGGGAKTGDGILELEWKVLCGNCSRVREAVHPKPEEGKSLENPD
ncbi:hypothetical protein V8E53_004773, partial [Lactarius tabidus]